MLSCSEQACTAGAAICSGTVATACKADGSGPEPGGTDCAANAQSCQDGACAPAVCDAGSCDPTTVCKPGAESCVGAQVARCNASGSGWLAPVDCVDGELCSGGSCKKPACEPGRRYCRDGDAYQCNETGEFENVVQSCASDEPCEDGECKPRRCTAGVPFCVNSDVYLCQNGAPAAALLQSCGSGRACQELFPGSAKYGAACLPAPCSTGEISCVQNQVGTCAPDGKSLSLLIQDCPAEGSVCTADATCRKSVIDALGVAESGEMNSADTLVANVITVHTPRKLTELQTYIVASSAPRQLRWLVYEQVGSAFVVKAEAVVSNTHDLELGVGVLSYQLEAGKTYLLGRVLSAGETTNDLAPFEQNLSFAVLVGSLRIPYAPSIDVKAMDNIQLDIVSFMRVSTELP
ncbi:MAG: hypothetical protein WDO74_12140 [Pseudomonadota bacterium]